MKVSALVLATAVTTASAALVPREEVEWKFPNIRIGYAGAHHDYGSNNEKRGEQEKRALGMPCHGSKAAVARSSNYYGLGAILRTLGFDSYTASRYDGSAVKGGHHHEHGPDHGDKHHKDHDKEGHHHKDGHHHHHGPDHGDKHHKDHDKEGHHHKGDHHHKDGHHHEHGPDHGDKHHKDHDKDGHHHHGGHKEQSHNGLGGYESDGAFAPPPEDAEIRILPIFPDVHLDLEKKPHFHGYRGHGHHRHRGAHRALSAVLGRIDRIGESLTSFIRSLRFEPLYLVLGYIVGAFLGIVASRKIKAARRRRQQAIQLDEEVAAPSVVAVVDEKN